MSFWETVGAAVLGFVITGLIAAAATALTTWWRRTRSRPDWEISLGSLNGWQVRRIGREVFSVVWHLYDEGGSEVSRSDIELQDLRRNGSFGVPAAPAARLLTIQWIDRARLNAEHRITFEENCVPIRARRQRFRLVAVRS